MPGTIYFIRNQDLYKIGITQDIDRRMGELKPDEVVATLVTAYYIEYEKELHHRYKHCRIPQTEYFRLSSDEVKEVLHEMTGDGVPHWVNESKLDALASWQVSAVSLFALIGIEVACFMGINHLHTWYWQLGLWLLAIGCLFYFGIFVGISMFMSIGSSIKGLFDWAWWKYKENAKP